MGGDKPPWIVAHSTHVSYPTHHKYMQVVPNAKITNQPPKEPRDAIPAFG